MSMRSQPRTVDGRYTFDPKTGGDADLAGGFDQDAEKIQAARRAEKLWRMGLHGRAADLAHAMGALTGDDLASLNGEGRFVLFDRGEFTTCELRGNGDVEEAGPFDPNALPDMDEERYERVAAA